MIDLWNFRSCDWNRETETCPTIRMIFRPQFAFVSFNNGFRYRQAHSHSSGFGGEKRLEQAPEILAGNPRSAIANPDFDHGWIRGFCVDPHDPVPGTLIPKRVHRIDDQVEQNLLELNPVAPDHRQVRHHGGYKFDLPGGGVGFQERKDFGEFLDRLRHARDKAEFDEFLASRRNRGSDAPSPA